MRLQNVSSIGLVLLLTACGGGGSALVPSHSAPAGNSDGANALPALPAHYTVVDLGAHVQPAAINSSNVVVGKVFPNGTGNGEAFRYSNGASAILAGDGSAAADINDNGLAVGWIQSHAAAFQANGTVTDLGAPPLSYAQAFAVNNAGTIAGTSTQSGIATCGGLLTFFAAGSAPNVINWQIQSLTLSNDGNTAVGLFQPRGPACLGTISVNLYPGGGAVPVPTGFTVDASTTAVMDSNSAGDVVGFGPTNTYQSATFFVHNANATSTEIDPPAGYSGIDGNGINDSEWIVGMLQATGNSHAFVWVNGVTTDLNTLMPASCNWVLNSASDVNNAGYIVGTGTVNGTPHGFLLIPG